jgi:monothiol glutaredoxin
MRRRRVPQVVGHAAEYFRREGFRNLYNLRGGIDAWSLLVDTSVPRY